MPAVHHEHRAPGPALASETDISREPEFLFGVDLFNHGFWWESHEELESLWLRLPRDSSSALMLQAVIQAAAAHLQLAMGRGTGIERMISRMDARARQAAAAAGHADCVESASVSSPAPPGTLPLPEITLLRIAIRPWWAHTIAYLRGRAAADPVAHDLTRFPFIELVSDS